ncbi:MAG: M23 family metallopeptidase, partial [Microbacterium sp.]
VKAGTPLGWWRGGIQVWVQHEGFLSRYLHLKTGSLAVFVGQEVTEGQLLGVMGMTGTATGVHLHFEIAVGDIQTDPVPFLTRLISTPIPASTTSANSSPEEDDMAKPIIISYTSTDTRNGIVGAALGFWHKFTAEEWAYVKHVEPWASAPVVKPGSAREYDLLRATLTQGVVGE